MTQQTEIETPQQPEIEKAATTPEWSPITHSGQHIHQDLAIDCVKRAYGPHAYIRSLERNRHEVVLASSAGDVTVLGSGNTVKEALIDANVVKSAASDKLLGKGWATLKELMLFDGMGLANDLDHEDDYRKRAGMSRSLRSLAKKGYARQGENDRWFPTDAGRELYEQIKAEEGQVTQ